MIILLTLAAIVLLPAAFLAVAGPGELELMTTPKNLGVFGAEIVSRPRPLVAVNDLDLCAAIPSEVQLANHAACIPAGMFVGADA